LKLLAFSFELFGFGDRFINVADHVESLLWQTSSSPDKIIWKPLSVSSSFTYLPGEPVKTSATKNGCDKNRSSFRHELL